MYTLVTSLHALGVAVNVVVLNHGTLERKLQDAGIDVIVLDENELNGFKILLNLIRVIRDKRPDVIHTHRHKENILGSIAAFATSNIPSLRTVHGILEKRPALLQLAKRFVYFLDWATGRFLQSRIIAVSNDLAEILEKHFPQNKIRVIENGIFLDDQYSTKGKPKSTLQEGIFTVGIVGRLVPIKRVDILIATASHLLKQATNPGIRFYVIGDGPLREALEALSRSSGTAEIVQFLGHQDEILSHIQNLDALMMTSDHEGLPMVLLEAMVLRVPVIAHRTGGIPDLLEQGNCGILVDAQEPEAYAQAILQLKESSELQAQISDKAFARVTAKYSAKKNAQAYLSEYLSLLAP